ncbi:MAG: tRNA lysidine(34) synthetase TilS, partial [Firmicutes bacterium]|nr:tRNA lysidine(34) synthetase TilS [Bacillota bacterium]
MRSLLNKSILPARARLGLAVSGGIDSMVMLHACAAELSNPLTVINIDHGLRPESAAECAFVRDYCQTIGVLCRTQTVKVSKNGNIEQRARDARYKAFDGALDSGECDYILTAHTAGDNAETVLLHILRGSALRGARGI